MTTTINAARRYSKSRNERMLERDLDGRIYNYPGDLLWRKAGEKPSLDLRFADSKSLVDATTGQNLVTFTRASGGTYVDSQGVIRNATTNLLLRSEEFDQSPWTNVAGGPVVTANYSTAPTGQQTADRLVFDAADKGLTQSVTGATIGAVYTASVYIKGTAGQTIRFSPVGGIGTALNAVLSGNWQRLTISGAATGTTVGLTINTFGGATARDIEAWGAQLEQSSTVGEYIPTGATINSAPRFDHNPTTGGSLGLLVEEQRTNLLLRSEEFDNAGWVKTGLLAFGSGSTANATTAPNGTVTADLLTEDTSTSNHQVYQVFSTTSGTAYTATVFAKLATGSRYVRLAFGAAGMPGFTGVNVDLSTGSVLSTTGTPVASDVTPAGNGWYRILLTQTSTSDSSGASVQCNVLNSSQIGSYQGDGTSGIYLWGAQLEAGSFPTSYIPTTTAAVTRSADVASISGSNFSSWFSSTLTDHTFFVQSALRNSIPNGVAIEGFEGANLRGLTVTVDGSGLRPRIIQRHGSSRLDTALNAGPWQSSIPVRYAVTTSASSNQAINGVTSATGTVPAQSDWTAGSGLSIGSRANGGSLFFNNCISRITFWPLPLSQETLQRITQ